MSEEEKQSISITQVNQLIKNNRYGHLIQLYLKKDSKKLKKYNTLKLKDKAYVINQDIAVCALNDDIYSAKLIKIYCIQDPLNTYIPILQVQWYYTKQDLKLGQQYMNAISEKELFFSTHTEYLPANKLQCAIQVLTFEQYTALEYEEETIFFTRAAIDLTTMEPKPSIQSWNQNCVCRMPQNPDIQMIKCDNCQEWFHLTCVGLKEDSIEQIEQYKCPGCY